MKKKGTGRVAGTIGWILSIVICLGTIAYATYTHVSGFLGASTGNSIMARFSEDVRVDGEVNSKKLIQDVLASTAGTTEGLTYESYTLSYVFAATQNLDGEDGRMSETAEGVQYVTAEYVYDKAVMTIVTDELYLRYKVECVYDKVNGVQYMRVDASNNENVDDSLLLDGYEWEKLDQVTQIGTTALQMFAPLPEATLQYNYLTSEYLFETEVTDVANDNIYLVKYGFTVGYRPVFYAKSQLVDGNVMETLTATFSNINNTKVELPESLKTKMTEVA